MRFGRCTTSSQLARVSRERATELRAAIRCSWPRRCGVGHAVEVKHRNIRGQSRGWGCTHTHTHLFHSNARRPRPPRCRPRRCPPPASACCGPSSRASSPASTPLSPSRSPRAAETADQPQIQCSQSSCSRLTTGLDGASRAVSTSIPPPTTPLGPRLSTSGPRGPPPAATGHHHRLSRRLSCPSPSPQGPYTSQLLSQPRPPHLPASRLAG